LGTTQTVQAAVVSKGYNGVLNAGTGTGTEQFVLDINSIAANQFRFLVRDAAGNGKFAQSSIDPSTTTYTDPLRGQAVWHHLVGVCNQPAGKVYIYVDGLLSGTGDIATNSGILAQPLPMTIGARKGGGANEYDNQWLATVDDV